MLERTLITSKRNILNIKTDFPRLEMHFSDPRNFADIVLNQINQDRFYDPYFEGKTDLTILDLGANIGLFSLYAHDSAKAVYSVEPTPSHFIKLTEMTKNYPNINRINAALHNKDEDIQFYIYDGNTTMNSTANRYGQAVNVKGITLATLLQENNIEHVDIVKCDIEGSEMIALTEETIAPVKDKIDFWFLEVHATDVPTEVNRQRLGDIFQAHGYKVDMLRTDAMIVYK